MNDDEKTVTLDRANEVLDLFSTVPMPKKHIYENWAAFSLHGEITAKYENFRGSPEYLALQKSHLKLLIYALVSNFGEIFKIAENIQRISGITQGLDSLLTGKIDPVDIVQTANSITLMKKLIKPADM